MLGAVRAKRLRRDFYEFLVAASGTLSNCARVIVSRRNKSAVCVPRGIAIKFRRNGHVLVPRGVNMSTVTVPRDRCNRVGLNFSTIGGGGGFAPIGLNGTSELVRRPSGNFTLFLLFM